MTTPRHAMNLINRSLRKPLLTVAIAALVLESALAPAAAQGRVRRQVAALQEADPSNWLIGRWEHPEICPCAGPDSFQVSMARILAPERAEISLCSVWERIAIDRFDIGDDEIVAHPRGQYEGTSDAMSDEAGAIYKSPLRFKRISGDEIAMDTVYGSLHLKKCS